MVKRLHKIVYVKRGKVVRPKVSFSPRSTIRYERRGPIRHKVYPKDNMRLHFAARTIQKRLRKRGIGYTPMKAYYKSQSYLNY